MGKPEVSTSAVIEGKPSLTRTKRLARYAMEQTRRAMDVPLSVIPSVIARTPQRVAETGKEIQSRKLTNAVKLENRGRTFLNAIRETFDSESLGKGLVIHPKTGNAHAITVQAVAHDSDRLHRTEAVVDITSKERHVTRLAVGAIEPTVGSGRRGSPPTRQAWVQVVDPTADSQRIFHSMDFGLAEQEQLVEVANQTFGEVEQACDRGNLEVYASPVQV